MASSPVKPTECTWWSDQRIRWPQFLPFFEWENRSPSGIRSHHSRLFFREPRGEIATKAQCAFIARYHRLQEQLNWNPTFFTQQPCNKFDAWFSELNPQGITLIFPSAYKNTPASIFGHSSLRIDQKGQTEQTRILAYTINYAAEVPSQCPN